MFKINGQEMSDMEVAQGYWERVKKRMEWCRHEAEEYVKNHGRRKFYKLTYSAGDGETYAAISDEDVAKIKDGIKETLDLVLEESGPDASEEEKADALHDYFLCSGNDIDWDQYIPEKDQHFLDEPAFATNVDFDDVIYCSRFRVKHTSMFEDDKDKLRDNVYNLQLNNEEFVNLVAAKLFDENLTFYDLRVLYKDLYERIESQCYDVHQHHMVFMTEIDEVAKAILDSKTRDELPKSINLDSPFSGFILRTIFNNPDQFDDPALLKALRLAVARPDLD